MRGVWGRCAGRTRDAPVPLWGSEQGPVHTLRAFLRCLPVWGVLEIQAQGRPMPGRPMGGPPAAPGWPAPGWGGDAVGMRCASMLPCRDTDLFLSSISTTLHWCGVCRAVGCRLCYTTRQAWHAAGTKVQTPSTSCERSTSIPSCHWQCALLAYGYEGGLFFVSSQRAPRLSINHSHLCGTSNTIILHARYICSTALQLAANQ